MEDINHLGDDLLLHILSFVPVKEAISLSIVSKKWYKMIYSLPCLCFDDGFRAKRIKRVDSYKFMNFVDRVLFKHKGGLEKISIKCGGFVDSERVQSWIQYAISKSVRELDLEFGLKEFKEFDRLPLKVFTCNTLEVLTVKIISSTNFLCKLPAKICLPKLKTLQLHGLELSNKDDNGSIQRLISSCSMLEELKINCCTLSKNRNLSIINPTLKRLNIGYMGRSFEDYGIHIDAPSLVYFKCFYLPGKFSGKNLNSLVEAGINFGKSSSCYDTIQAYNSATLDLFRSISNVKSLHLSGFFEEIILRVGSIMPKLQKLTYLMLDGLLFEQWERLVSVLPQCFPNVEALDFKVKHTFGMKEVNILSEIPSCCWPELKKLNILSFENKESELLMIKHLLNSAQSLEKLTVRNMERSRNLRVAYRRSITRKLSKFRKNCKITVL